MNLQKAKLAKREYANALRSLLLNGLFIYESAPRSRSRCFPGGNGKKLHPLCPGDDEMERDSRGPPRRDKKNDLQFEDEEAGN